LHYQITIMKKTVLLLAIATCFLAPRSQAQKLFFVFGHAEYASSVGKLRPANNSGLGLEIGAGVGMNKTFFTATIGTTWFAVNRHPGSTNTNGGLKYTPYKIGIRRYVLLKNMFVKADAGMATMKYIDKEGKTTKLTTSFGAGVKLTRLEFLVDYNSVAGYGSWVGLKVGFAFGL
jgi:hypothetical protein